MYIETQKYMRTDEYVHREWTHMPGGPILPRSNQSIVNSCPSWGAYNATQCTHATICRYDGVDIYGIGMVCWVWSGIREYGMVWYQAIAQIICREV